MRSGAFLDPARRRGLDALPASAWKAIDAFSLEGQSLFITGATGFAGRWLLAAIERLNDTLERPLHVRALTRSAQALQAPWLTWVHGDVRDFTDNAPSDLVLHAALASTATPPGGDAELRDTAAGGIASAMRHAVETGVRRSVVLSSGAVYGVMRAPVAESAPLHALAPGDTYALAKREVEGIALAAAGPRHDVVIARPFACIGPGYRSHSHLAHVSLVDDARAGRPIRLTGDGTAVRSYLFGADLAVWLLALLSAHGTDVVNVGSDEPLTLLDLARIVAHAAGRAASDVVVGRGASTQRHYFVPDITRARGRYRLAPWTSVEAAVGQMLAEQA
jgi:nucleoside-diphosphate-sugar epimerase